MRLKSIMVLLAVAGFGVCATHSREVFAQEGPTRVILIIGDGASASYWTAAKYALDHLAVEWFPVGGLVDTRSSDSKITDSAAAATAYSAGVRTYNGAIGVDSEGAPVTTVLEIAQRRGLATGLVATSSITHATPAAFASHVPDRNMEWEIARQLARADVDVMLAGGRRFFDPTRRPDSLDLLSEVMARYTYVETSTELGELKTNQVRRLFGLFADVFLPAAPRRSPTLPAMTRAALGVLDQNPNGFFLMVEGSQPDWRGHDRAPLEAITAEMLDLDEAVTVALEYQASHPETLIVVTADHETGGLAIQQTGARRLVVQAAERTDSTVAQLVEARSVMGSELASLADSASWYMERLSDLLRRESQLLADSSVLVARYTTGNHTAQMVPLFASGPGAERFGGIKENWRIGELLREAVSR
ncbi:MAG: alkaline phosphatase [Longimicrobiales bacterium]